MSTLPASLSTLELFFQQLPYAKHRLLLMDYDGTIAPFQVDRNRAFPYPNVPELIDAIMATCATRVVLVSGRSAREIPPLLGLRPYPEIWGSHGFERLSSDGRYDMRYVGERTTAALSEAVAELEREGGSGR